jgi:hypothetical protein
MTFSASPSNNSVSNILAGNVTNPLPTSITPQRALEIITSSPRPRDTGLAQWSRLSNVEQLRIVRGIDGPAVQLARAEVTGGRVNIIPEADIRSDLPSFNIPNNVGAEGFSPGLTTHDYIVTVNAPPTLSGPAGLAAIGRALTANPTPGVDQPSTPKGTRNDVGHLVPFDGGNNYVRSYVIPSSDPRRSDAVINYTVAGEHAMEEGFVMRFAELRPNGSIELVTYGEGNALVQSEMFSGRWDPIVQRVWKNNANEIFNAVQNGSIRK